MFFLSEILSTFAFFFFFAIYTIYTEEKNLKAPIKLSFLFFFFFCPTFLNGFKRRTIFWFFTARWNSRFPVIEPRLSPLYRKHPASIDTSPIIALGLTENINGHCTLPAAMLLIVPLKNFCRVSFSVARCYYAVFQ